jgi:RNA polymerase sigma factor (sigma-70 family)
MAKDEKNAAAREIHTLFRLGTTGGRSDKELLEWYTRRSGEAADLAFAALVERHGPMVLRVCRAVLGDEHEAHDAFQATFLVLVRRAGSLWARDSLGPWLHQVACRVARCARLAAARRQRHERNSAALRPESTHPDASDRDDLGPLLHAELARLPDRYRAVIVLCYLEGLTQQQAAQHLGWPIGTVQSRLARGRERLRRGCTRRGLAPSLELLGAAHVADPALGAVPVTLAQATIHAAGTLAAGGTTTAGAVPASVAKLMEGALRTMFLIQLKRVAAVVLAFGVAAAGAGVLARQEAEEASPTPPRVVTRVDMPSYVVEPPDLIVVEVQEALPGMPITGERLVRPDGKISLGYYGEVHVAGLTTDEIKVKVIDYLRKHLTDTQLGLIAPDPHQPRRSKTVSAADSVRVYVEVKAYNSKNYYILGDVVAPGRLPVTGNETVLDAINFAGGLLPSASRSKLRLVRPAVPGVSGAQVLDVNHSAIVYEGDPATNYQLRPGDRLIVLHDPKPEAETAHDELAPPAARPLVPKADAAPKDHVLAPSATDLRGLEQRLEGVERRLDRVIDLLGGAQTIRPRSR